MSIYISKADNDLYEVRVYATRKDAFGVRGCKIQKDIKTIYEAELIAEELQEELDSFGVLTFRELNEEYLKFRENKISPTTLSRIKFLYTPVLEFMGDVKIDKINNRLVQQYVDYRQKQTTRQGERIKKNTVKREYAHIRAVLNFAVKYDYLTSNRVVGVEYVEDEEDFEPAILSAEFIASMLKDLKQNYYSLYIPILLATTMGLRRGELLGLKWESIDFEKNTINIKNNVVDCDCVVEKSRMKTTASKRMLYLSEFLKSELLEHLEMNKRIESDYVCANIFLGTVPTPEYITHKFHRYIKERFGVEVRVHDLRHSFNQLMYESGIDNTTRAKVLGHSNVRTTDIIYTHQSLTNVTKAVSSVSGCIKNCFKTE